MNNNTFCVIMAGGSGTRFWPKSRIATPKQFLDILGCGKSFIRQTFERFLPLVTLENFVVVTNSCYKQLVMEHIPEIDESQILCEPIARNTAPCIAYAAYSIASKCPTAQMIITPSDHYITREDLFEESITECLEFISHHDALMTIGIKPSRPETGYGYIQLSSDDSISKVKCFTEKPEMQLAKKFVECGEFVWNSGIFIWSAESIIAAFKQYLPECHEMFSAGQNCYGTPLETTFINRVFSDSKAISIDYAIMEKANNVYVKIGEFTWCDVGTWSSLFSHAQRDEDGNLASSQCYAYNTHNTIISAPDEKLVVVSGLKEYIVVDTADVLMICPQSEEQSVKGFVEDIKYRGDEEYL